jgi:predicted trehalose synthase
VEYIHMNPVHAHLAERSEDWPHSSATNKFMMDAMPTRLKARSSGAKAPSADATAFVGAKAPSP